MTRAGEPLELRFLTGSQELYGEATLRQVDVQSRQVVDLLGWAPRSACR